MGTQPNAQPNWGPIEGSYKPECVRVIQTMLAWNASQRRTLPQCLASSWLGGSADDAEDMPNIVLDKIAGRAEHSDLKMLLLNMVAAKLQGESLEHYQQLW